jgi:hypothetical protein
MDYTFTIGSDDPRGLAASGDADAVAQIAGYLRTEAAADLRERPEAVLTLMGPNGLVTRPSERIDEFVTRITPASPGLDADTLEPGDTNTPDCNGD